MTGRIVRNLTTKRRFCQGASWLAGKEISRSCRRPDTSKNLKLIEVDDMYQRLAYFDNVRFERSDGDRETAPPAALPRKTSPIKLDVDERVLLFSW